MSIRTKKKDNPLTTEWTLSTLDDTIIDGFEPILQEGKVPMQETFSTLNDDPIFVVKPDSRSMSRIRIIVISVCCCVSLTALGISLYLLLGSDSGETDDKNTNDTIVGYTGTLHAASFEEEAPVSGIVSDEQTAYLVRGKDGVKLIDITNPSTPKLVSVINPSNGLESASSVSVAGSLLAVSDSTTGAFQLFNVSNRLAPSLLSTTRVPRKVSEASISFNVRHLSENYLFLLDGLNGLHVFDCGDPSNPVAVDLLISQYRPNLMDINENLAFVIADEILIIINIKDIRNPLVLSTIDLVTNLTAVAVRHPVAHLKDANGIDYFVNVSNPQVPVWLPHDYQVCNNIK
eukprot:TRINITY_DN9643_c1_g1_i1.p1 TRINITY_DN9643_c1_g1~~TRINITY_DN9643_c1_g1_i1.p1  ORF type:complete len:346 (+),score=47.73 TRINITY_DN9643_c1_g1_i1:41-1078(+)